MTSGKTSRVQLFMQWWAFLLLCVLAAAAHADAPAPNHVQANYEVRFLEGMIDHHAMAAGMASTCETKNVHQELRELCTDIRIAQLGEIETMQGWLGSWYGIAYSPEMSRGEMRQMEKLALLAGAEYEIAFMQQMIGHHTTAIRNAARCLVRAYHDDLVDMCLDIIESQALEIRAMRMWLCQWHGICGRHGHSRSHLLQRIDDVARRLQGFGF